MQGRLPLILIGAYLALAITGCGGSDDSSSSGSTAETSAGTPVEESPGNKPKVKVPSGSPPEKLIKKELIKGTGTKAKGGDEVTVHYVGVLYKSGQELGSSWDREEPLSFTIGASEVILGWEQGVEGMQVGGRRELIVPPELAYGSLRAEAIPPNSTLIFIIDLLEVDSR